ncbi:hypothetical protein [Phaffia rhodozyma]|uniref:Uncharacterized protein n=1 Tax=Phaffia rhodozyma TaxID=264483 RepID=A0A0F7SMC8_PHARH|nr:hypothetical protein [Phaffia rhodozyma]
MSPFEGESPNSPYKRDSLSPPTFFFLVTGVPDPSGNGIKAEPTGSQISSAYS